MDSCPAFFADIRSNDVCTAVKRIIATTPSFSIRIESLRLIVGHLFGQDVYAAYEAANYPGLVECSLNTFTSRDIGLPLNPRSSGTRTDIEDLLHRAQEMAVSVLRVVPTQSLTPTGLVVMIAHQLGSETLRAYKSIKTPGLEMIEKENSFVYVRARVSDSPFPKSAGSSPTVTASSLSSSTSKRGRYYLGAHDISSEEDVLKYINIADIQQFAVQRIASAGSSIPFTKDFLGFIFKREFGSKYVYRAYRDAGFPGIEAIPGSNPQAFRVDYSRGKQSERTRAKTSSTSTSTSPGLEGICHTFLDNEQTRLCFGGTDSENCDLRFKTERKDSYQSRGSEPEAASNGMKGTGGLDYLRTGIVRVHRNTPISVKTEAGGNSFSVLPHDSLVKDFSPKKTIPPVNLTLNGNAHVARAYESVENVAVGNLTEANGNKDPGSYTTRSASIPRIKTELELPRDPRNPPTNSLQPTNGAVSRGNHNQQQRAAGANEDIPLSTPCRTSDSTFVIEPSIPVVVLNNNWSEARVSAVTKEIMSVTEIGVDAQGIMDTEGAEQLFLVQIVMEHKEESGQGKGKKIFIYDMSSSTPQNPSTALICSLKEILGARSMLKVFHDARRDVKGLWNCFSVFVQPIFDTQALYHNIKWQRSMLWRSDFPHVFTHSSTISEIDRKLGYNLSLESGEPTPEQKVRLQRIQQDVALQKYLPQYNTDRAGINKLLVLFGLPPNPCKDEIQTAFKNMQFLQTEAKMQHCLALVKTQPMLEYAAHAVVSLPELKAELQGLWVALSTVWSDLYFHLSFDPFQASASSNPYATVAHVPLRTPLRLSFGPEGESTNLKFVPRYFILNEPVFCDPVEQARQAARAEKIAEGEKEEEKALLSEALSYFPPAFHLAIVEEWQCLLQDIESRSSLISLNSGRRRLVTLNEVICDEGRAPLLRFSDGYERTVQIRNRLLAWDNLVSYYEYALQVKKEGAIRGTGRSRTTRDDSSPNRREKRRRTCRPLVELLPSDNSMGLANTLHKISFVRNRTLNRVIGFTLRLGRQAHGSADLLKDIISLLGSPTTDGNSKVSLLLIGRPGVGKTTLLREISNALSTQYERKVVVVDTFNEIAGHDDIPHPCIGRARRIQVHNNLKQHEVMQEAVQNHSPEVLVVDELKSTEHVRAATSLFQSGVSLVASAAASNLNDLLQNPVLVGLVGGVERMPLSAYEASTLPPSQRLRLCRTRSPTFSIAVEIWDTLHYCIHANVERSVDALLSRRHGSLREEDGSSVMPSTARVEERYYNGEGRAETDMRAVLQPASPFRNYSQSELYSIYG